LHGDVVDNGAVAELFRDVVNVNDEVGSAHVKIIFASLKTTTIKLLLCKRLKKYK
jgi:hypothetical protein